MSLIVNSIIANFEFVLNSKTITILDRDKPWFNSGIKREMKIRDSLHKKMRKQPNINNICKYKVHRNKVNNMIIHAKQQFFLWNKRNCLGGCTYQYHRHIKYHFLYLKGVASYNYDQHYPLAF
jgi:hypothetical protein